ncbi:serine/threonine-protein kinase [Microtetraspora malaysiensis]|uniref:serine/threonine-protein kinase n=1 Tax=Microtetraspora malaysiensis TaxID=161358 RepID=UPI003D8F45C7
MGSRLLSDRYELITMLGRGTMGTVWRAFDRTLGRDVAVKEIRQDPSLGAEQRRELRERMIREGRAAARISHPSVATVYDAIEIDGSPWIIMELVEGRSLEQVIEDEGPLPPRLVAEVGYELLDALRAAHAQGILHRDVKPSNVLITDTGRVVLTDFGIAKSEGDSALTRTGMVIGSPGYTSPERARGDHAGPESDLWSLGATLYFAVEGRAAYERASVAETLSALMTESADPPTQAGPLRPVLDGLLEKDHTLRLTSERAAAMLRTVADTPINVSPAATPPVRRLERERPTRAAESPAPSPRAEPPAPAPPPESPTPAPRPESPAPSSPPEPAGEVDADKTMLVIRPKAGLRLPRRPPRPARPPLRARRAGPCSPPRRGTHREEPESRRPPAPGSGKPGGEGRGPERTRRHDRRRSAARPGAARPEPDTARLPEAGHAPAGPRPPGARRPRHRPVRHARHSGSQPDRADPRAPADGSRGRRVPRPGRHRDDGPARLTRERLSATMPGHPDHRDP